MCIRDRFNIYDIFDIDSEDYEKAKKNVFTEVMTDTLYETLDCQGKTVVVWETLPGQYDQRADSAMQCVKLLNPASALSLIHIFLIIRIKDMWGNVQS